MAKFIKDICKRSRRVGSCLFLKRRGVTTISKCDRLFVLPGQHGLRRKKTSNYLLQLRAKQTLKYIYNVFERQFKNYYYKALRKKSNTGLLLLFLLETRLDNIVYRMGFAATRAEARQLVVHKHVLVSEKEELELSKEYNYFSQVKWKIVNIPSFQVKIGCYVGIKRTKIYQQRIQKSLQERDKNEKIPHWFSIKTEELFGRFNEIPKRSDLLFQFNEQLIIELYSR